ncbi:hypothetical protein QLQ12_36405 [Actinoplanes sp. NEAU-A12]|uniref:Uncharacterized protein n=1 Tax=Actinoplanes sandaracinus TaxID=3045177 RepID=A0ABT6WWG2_9ACTN|nr:hypothetical protein [Actinoplanes sandaracinus]MDI6104088.1 hypothetical protein [Actinoplanes sandaracinus]
MWGDQRVRRGCRFAALPLVLVLSIAWAALVGLGRGESVAMGEVPRLAIAAVVPHSVTPVVPEARLTGKPSPGPLLLVVAALVALLLGTQPRGRWSAAVRTAPAKTPSMLLHAVRGRAPPRRSA